MSDEEDILKETLLNEVLIEEEKKTEAAAAPLPEEILAQKIKAEKKKVKKKRNKRLGILGFIGFVVFIIIWGLKRPEASIEYGICKTYLELNVVYPTTLHVNELDVLTDGSYRLWFSTVDPNGSNRMDSFQCHFGISKDTGYLKLVKVRMGTIFLDQDKLNFFNNAIPYLVANPPDITWPYPLSDNVADLQFDESAFTNIRNLSQRMSFY